MIALKMSYLYMSVRLCKLLTVYLQQGENCWNTGIVQFMVCVLLL